LSEALEYIFFVNIILIFSECMFISISVENIDNINVDNLISITAKLNQL